MYLLFLNEEKNSKIRPIKEKAITHISKILIAFEILLESAVIIAIKVDTKLLEIITPKNSKQKIVLNNIKVK